MSHFTTPASSRIPEPALVRGFVITVTAVLSLVLKREIDISWLDSVLTIYSVIAPLIAAILIRRKVTPESEVRLRVQRALYTEPPKIGA